MKILFLNVWGNEMRDELLPYLQEHAADTDIFCLQEARDSMRLACAQVLSGFQEISSYKYISDDEYFSQSIFIKKDIKVIASGTLFADDLRVGLANYAKIKHGDNGMYVCNVHGRSRPNHKIDTPGRIQFSKRLIKHFKDKDAPVIIGGDFNLEPATTSVELFEERSYRNLIKEFAIKTTRNHFAWDRFPGNELYYSDYIFIDDTVVFQGFAVENNEVSDHLPMILRIEL